MNIITKLLKSVIGSKPPVKNHFRQRIPNFCSGYTPKEYDFVELDDLLENCGIPLLTKEGRAEWIAAEAKDGFTITDYHFEISVNEPFLPHRPKATYNLMQVYKRNGEQVWWVLGTLTNDIPSLPRFDK